MPLMINSLKNYNLSFTGEMADENKKDVGKKIVTGGGVIGAVTNISRFDAFKSAKSLSKGMTGITNSAKVVSNAAKQSKSLNPKAVENMKWLKTSVLKWGAKFKDTPVVKYLVSSPVFRGIASFLGYGFGILTLVSGCSDIVRVTSDALNDMK